MAPPEERSARTSDPLREKRTRLLPSRSETVSSSSPLVVPSPILSVTFIPSNSRFDRSRCLRAKLSSERAGPEASYSCFVCSGGERALGEIDSRNDGLRG